MTIFNLVLNSSNVSNSTNSSYTYKFVQGNFHIKNAQCCISQIIMPYSWVNISASIYQNATFQYKWVDGTTYSITLPDGFYQISDIQNYLYQMQISNNQYLMNTSTGQYQVFINLFTNVAYYSNQLILQTVPTSLPNGYSAPNGFVFSTTTAKTPQFIILNNNFQSILGFNYGSYPSSPSTSNYSVLSNITPNLTPVNSLIVCCDRINNNCASQSNILDTFYPNASYGSNINYSPTYEKWINMIDGSFENLTLFFYDQNFRNIYAKDSNIMISLLIKQDDIKQKIERVLNIKKLDFQDDTEN